MEELNIVYKPIKELKPYKKNAKKHSKEQVPTVCLEELTEEQIKAFPTKKNENKKTLLSVRKEYKEIYAE